MIKTTKAFSLLVISTLLFAPQVNSQVIKQVKGTQALVEFPNDVTEGEEYFALNPEGKKVAILVLKKVKGKKAIADVTKGRAQNGYSLVSRSTTTPSGFSPVETSSPDSSSRSGQNDFKLKKNALGGLLSLWQNTMNAVEKDATNSEETANMSGTSFGLAGFYDYSFSPNLQVRGIAGYDMYDVSSTIAINGCDSRTSTKCNVKISYLSFYGNLKYNFTLSSLRFFVMAGTGFMYALSKSSTALKASDISLTQLFTVGGGMDYKLNSKSFIPVSIEYGLFPPSEDVKASSIILRLGYGIEL